MRQESSQLELPLEDRGEAPRVQGSDEARMVVHGDERSVRQNKGSPGIDGMSV